MTPDAVRDALHALELRVVEQIAGLRAEVSAALAVSRIVDDHESRIRAVEGYRRPSWRDVGSLVSVLVGVGGVVVAVVTAART